MKSPIQIPPPSNWQDFETLCMKLWGEVWNCSNTIKKNGRLGQSQCGVDIYFTLNGVDFYGIQCKCKDNNTKTNLTKNEIDTEIDKARNFKPQLKKLYFATTLAKDVTIEEYIRLKSKESVSSGGFEIDIFFWDDIVCRLFENRNTYQWYVNDCQYIGSFNVDVKIVGENSKLTSLIRLTKTKYVLHPYWNDPKQKQLFDILRKNKNLSYGMPTKTNYSWCKIEFIVKNIGSAVLSDYHLIIKFIDGVNKYDIGCNYCNNQLINPSERAYINNRIDDNRELFYSEAYEDAVEFRPKTSKLIQEESRKFAVWILPELNTDKVKLGWIFLSNGYRKEACLDIEVVNDVEEKTETIYVDSTEELKPDESKLEYKIIEG